MENVCGVIFRQYDITSCKMGGSSKTYSKSVAFWFGTFFLTVFINSLKYMQKNTSQFEGGGKKPNHRKGD